MDKYKMIKVCSLFDYRVVDYWTAIIGAGLLEHRLFDTLDPKLKDIEEMLASSDNICYNIYDYEKERICADTMINNISGLTAQVHFSVHPEYFGKETIEIARFGAYEYFRKTNNRTGENLSTLFGITPVYNRKAIRFIKAVGYKEICVFDKICYIAKTNSHCDGLLTRLQKKEFTYGWKQEE